MFCQDKVNLAKRIQSKRFGVEETTEGDYRHEKSKSHTAAEARRHNAGEIERGRGGERRIVESKCDEPNSYKVKMRGGASNT